MGSNPRRPSFLVHETLSKSVSLQTVFHRISRTGSSAILLKVVIIVVGDSTMKMPKKIFKHLMVVFF
jgi:hypothetical protein